MHFSMYLCICVILIINVSGFYFKICREKECWSITEIMLKYYFIPVLRLIIDITTSSDHPPGINFTEQVLLEIQIRKKNERKSIILFFQQDIQNLQTGIRQIFTFMVNFLSSYFPFCTLTLRTIWFPPE